MTDDEKSLVSWGAWIIFMILVLGFIFVTADEQIAEMNCLDTRQELADLHAEVTMTEFDLLRLTNKVRDW